MGTRGSDTYLEQIEYTDGHGPGFVAACLGVVVTGYGNRIWAPDREVMGAGIGLLASVPLVPNAENGIPADGPIPRFLCPGSIFWVAILVSV